MTRAELIQDVISNGEAVQQAVLRELKDRQVAEPVLEKGIVYGVFANAFLAVLSAKDRYGKIHEVGWNSEGTIYLGARLSPYQALGIMPLEPPDISKLDPNRLSISDLKVGRQPSTEIPTDTTKSIEPPINKTRTFSKPRADWLKKPIFDTSNWGIKYHAPGLFLTTDGEKQVPIWEWLLSITNLKSKAVR